MKKSPKYPKISVITPSFNQGMFIEQTIESVLSQNYPNLEYWVIDGGSTDETVSILKKYKKHLQYVSEPDRGQTDAINKGFSRATGDILAYLNSDDLYLPNALKTVASAFNKHSTALWVTGDYRIIDGNNKEMQPYVVAYKKILRRFLHWGSIHIANSIIQPSTFWKKELLSNLGGFDSSLRYVMDYDFWLRAMTISQPLLIHEPLSLFRIHGQSKGGSQYIKQFKEEQNVLERYQQNRLICALHKFHSTAIINAYRLLK